MNGSTLLSGHQPSFFHAGILAKRIALDKRTEGSKSSGIWLVADQDINDPGLIEYPDLESEGNLVKRAWNVLPRRIGVPTSAYPWEKPTPPPEVSSQLPPSVHAGLDRMYNALIQADGETVADRFHNATELMLGELVEKPCALVKASTLLDTKSGQDALEKISSEPLACALTWNDAIRVANRSARELKHAGRDEADIEAPVWVLDSNSRRQRGTVADVRAHLQGKQRVLPRAFLMTAIARAELCEEMIHGTGGAQYEEVTRQWAESFLGFKLAPITVVTATLRLPLHEYAPASHSAPSIDDIRRIEHDPWPNHRDKMRWVEKIEAAPARSDNRSKLFLEMHKEMKELRAPLDAKISEMQVSRRAAQAAETRLQIAEDRTWPWPLHDEDSLRRLASDIN